MKGVRQTFRATPWFTVATVATASALLAVPAWPILMRASGCPDRWTVFVHALG